MTTRESYLKRYLKSSYQEKNKKRLKKRSNLAVYDDDIDWKSFASSAEDKNQSEVEENDPDEAPIIAEIKDDTIRKWQPVSSVGHKHKSDELPAHVCEQKRKRMDSPDLSPRRKKERSTISPIRQVRSSSSDLSPQRGENLSEMERQGTINPVLQSRQRTRQGHKKRRPYSPDLVSSLNSDKHRILDDHYPRGHQIEHNSDIDGNAQGFNCSVSITISEDQSLPRNSKSMPLSMMGKPRQMKVTAQDNESLHHQYADVTVYDYRTKTIYRDREGRKIDPKLQALEKEKKEQEDENFILWGRG